MERIRIVMMIPPAFTTPYAILFPPPIMLFAVGLAGVFFVIGLPAVAVLGAGTLIFCCHHYHTIVMSTSSGGDRVAWPSDSLVDMFWKVPYVGWLVACSTGPAMLLGGILAKQIGVLGILVPALVFWILFPLVQLSSLYGSSIWVPFTPVTLRKMAGKPSAVITFYLLSLGATAFGTAGIYLAYFTPRLGMGGAIAGGLMMAAALFAYARLIGRLAFAASFVGAEERPDDSHLPQHTADRPVEPPKPKRKKKGKPKAFVQTSQRQVLKTADAEDGVGYDVTFAEEVPAEPEEEKPFVPPQNAWDDEPVTAYDAKPPEVEPAKVVDPKTFEVKESEMKLISRDDAPREPDRVWTSDVWTTFLGDPNTISNYGVASIWFVVDGIFWGILRSFLD